MTPKKFAATSAANDQAARLILADPDRYPGLMQLWARLHLGLTTALKRTIEAEYPETLNAGGGVLSLGGFHDET